VVDGALDQFLEAAGRHGHGLIVAAAGVSPPAPAPFRALSGGSLQAV
jgi:hypothetical protein